MPAPLRLLCALLILLLALPAMQASACAPETGGSHASAHAHEGHDQAPARPAPQTRHECVGCIPPIDVGVYRAVEPLNFIYDRTERRIETALPASRSAPPEPPPPRTTV